MLTQLQGSYSPSTVDKPEYEKKCMLIADPNPLSLKLIYMQSRAKQHHPE